MAKAEIITSIFDEIETDQEVHDIWGSTYLPIQWQNPLGKWEAPLEHWGGSMLEFDYKVSQVRHQSKLVDGFLMDSISIAPFVPPKVYWGYIDSNGKYVIANEPDMSDGNPWRSRVHILALMKEAQSETPVILTAGSNTGKHLLANVRQGQMRLRNMLKKIGKTKTQPYLFWMEMIAGKPVTVGEGDTLQTICPPVAVAPANLHEMKQGQITEYLTDLYVGPEVRDLLDSGLREEGQKWVARRPEQLKISDGDSVAAPAMEDPKIEVLHGGLLYIPDLSAGNRQMWIECAMSVPGLFENEGKAGTAFKSVMRKDNLSGPTDPKQWEAWRVEIDRRWDENLLKAQEVARELESRQ